MFGQKHYVPILKWKAAERQALEKLSGGLTSEEKGYVSPLIQLVMPNPKGPKKGEREKDREEQLNEAIVALRARLQLIPEEILKAWGPEPAFLDVSLLYTSDLRAESLDEVLSTAQKMGMFLIPVTNLDSDDAVTKAVCSIAPKYDCGLCLRLVRADFKDQNLPKKINEFLTSCAVPIDQIDLLIDLKEDQGNEYLSILTLSQSIPRISEWRTFTFASGAFPVDLSGCELGENLIPRTDWKNWLIQQGAKLKRHPSFADYVIQHPIYKESAQFFAPSASIRYTLKDEWLVMRGQKGKHSQYLANAQLLSNHPKFFGENFSYGDSQIKLMGKDVNSKKTGNATTWLVYGVNHHLACVIDQLASLS